MAKAPQQKSPDMGGGSFGAVPKMNAGMAFSEVGSAGLRAFAGYVREEFLPELIGRQGTRVYREMGDNSPIVGAVLFAVQGVLRKAEWRVEAADDTPEAQEKADFVESLMDDMSHTWEDFIVECLSMLQYGFAPHEIVYKRRSGDQPPGGKTPSSKYDDGLIGWKRLPLRGQDTVLKWFFDENGDVLGLTQQPWIGPLLDVPIEKLLVFRPISHKNNPEGRSVLRNAYRSYFFIKRLEEQEAILFERLSGIPVMKVPNAILEGAASGNAQAIAALDAYKKLVVNVRIDEQMGILIPSDTYQGQNGPSTVPMYEFKLETPQAGGKSTMDANTPITRHKQDVMTSILCDFIEMGHTSRGAQNLAETKVDLFMQAAEGWLNSIAAVLNRHALPRLWRINGFDRALMPQFVPDMAQRTDLDALGKFILSLSQAGMPLFPDDDLEAYVRDAAGLPDASDNDSFDAEMRADASSGAEPEDAQRAKLRRVVGNAALRAIAAKRRQGR